MTKPSSHYSPFGSLIPNRSWSDANRVYRYGFNGKEKDFETSSDNYDFGARIYDGRLGRFFSTDLFHNYGSNISMSSFQFARNSPIFCIDKDGKFWQIAAFVGGLVAGTIVGIIKNEPIGKVITRAVACGVAAAIVATVPIALAGYGVSSSGLLLGTITVAPIGVIIQEGIRQTGNILIGEEDDYNKDEFEMDFYLSVPTVLLGQALNAVGEIALSTITKETLKQIPKSELNKLREIVRAQLKKQSKNSGHGKLKGKRLKEATDLVIIRLLKERESELKGKIKDID
ncbi:MAG: hypothetical protein JNM67_12740, partial [Bacteroidetes bacterium]|nr:hypothetical protein [Bacteroidota bacterium]